MARSAMLVTDNLHFEFTLPCHPLCVSKQLTIAGCCEIECPMSYIRERRKLGKKSSNWTTTIQKYLWTKKCAVAL